MMSTKAHIAIRSHARREIGIALNAREITPGCLRAERLAALRAGDALRAAGLRPIAMAVTFIASSKINCTNSS